MTEGLQIKNGILEHCTSRDGFVVVPEGVHTIGDGACKGCVSLRQMRLPDSLREIKSNAWKGCRNLEQLKLPKGICRIGDYAFHRCHMLEEIQIPQTVERLGNCVFHSCDHLKRVSMPGVRSFGRQTFVNDEALESILLSSQLDPDSIRECFTGCHRLTNITFSDGTSFKLTHVVDILNSTREVPPAIQTIVKDIYRYLEIEGSVLTKFLNDLKHVDLPEGITGIGKGCFFDKRGILTVTFPSTLQEIHSRAFRNCISLERLRFQTPPLQIHKDAFKNCTSLRFLSLPDQSEYELHGLATSSEENVPGFVRQIHAQVLGNFSLSGSVLLKYRGAETRVTVPDGVTVIGPRAFAGNEGINKVLLPDSVKIIEERAFEDCLVLQSIHFPDALEEIGTSAFENCVKLLHVDLPESLTVLRASTFKRCKALKEVRFGKHLVEIGEMSFYGCQKLHEVKLPDTLRSIGDMAFYQSKALKRITLPSGILHLGKDIFTRSGIQAAIVHCNLPEDSRGIFSYCFSLQSLAFTEHVLHISDQIAIGCQKLTSVTLPATLESIGKQAFEKTPYLEHMPENGRINNILLDGSHLTGDVVLEEDICAIAGGAFYGNKDLNSIQFPDSLRQIGARAFCGCTGLKEIHLPELVKELSEGVFAYCTGLEKLTAKGKIKKIGEAAFFYCTRLVSLPSSFHAAWIGDKAWEKTPFYEQLRKKSIGVPAILGHTILDGSTCKGSITIPEGIQSILTYAFAGNEDITSIRFPKSLKVIEKAAFMGCKKLKEMQFQAPLSYLGESAFEKCIALDSVTCQVGEIPARAFAWCEALKHTSFPETRKILKEGFIGCRHLKEFQFHPIAWIGERAFCQCDSFTSLVLVSTKEIKERAFADCGALKSVVLSEITELGAYCFEDCGQLSEVVVKGNQLAMDACAFSGSTRISRIILGKNPYKLEQYKDLFDTAIPELARRIYASALSCFIVDENLSLTEYTNYGHSIIIPAGIQKIEGEVFRDRAGLSEISIPESVEAIGPRAFDKTDWLDQQRKINPLVSFHNILLDAASCSGTVILPKEIRKISGWAFANCLGLKKIVFTSQIQVEEYAFRNCIYLNQVTLENGCSYRLFGLEDLKKNLPDVVQQIFRECYHCFKMDGKGRLSECTGNIEHMLLPNGISIIGEGAFQNSNLLTDITLSNEVEEIESNAFFQCKWLTRVKQAEYLKKIGPSAFAGCIRLESVEGLEHLEILGSHAFENCTELKEILLPEGLEEIPDKAFYRCHQLKRVTLPSTLKRIGKEAFAFCYHLSEINLPKHIELDGERVFAWCGELKIRK